MARISAKVPRLNGKLLAPTLSTNSQALKYRIRCATKKDIIRIDECNRLNLPEHYNHQFYENHLIRWPELSLIAETDQQEMVGVQAH
ncbi:hypothetical protein EON65_46200 [archaeon]|nr:MAG: hypothetical protein EON65_46200 [archaeon]